MKATRVCLFVCLLEIPTLVPPYPHTIPTLSRHYRHLSRRGCERCRLPSSEESPCLLHYDKALVDKSIYGGAKRNHETQAVAK